MNYYNHTIRLQLKLFILLALFPIIVLATPKTYQTKNITAYPGIQTGKITIIIVGIKNNVGMMRVGLFNTPAAYSDMTQPAAPLAYKKGSAVIRNQQSEITFTHVPYGIYAVKLFQDELMLGRLKRNEIGKPLEGVGISNNPKIRTRLPSWDQAKFILNKPAVTIVVQMQNF
jgi:uncharacterized protein (DUF2141 family)